MSEVPAELRYTPEHEWIRVEGDQAIIGVTDFAQDALTDVVWVELPEVGMSVGAMESCGSVESVKSVSEIYAPIAGNRDLEKGDPALGDRTVFTLEIVQ